MKTLFSILLLLVVGCKKDDFTECKCKEDYYKKEAYVNQYGTIGIHSVLKYSTEYIAMSCDYNNQLTNTSESEYYIIKCLH